MGTLEERTMEEITQRLSGLPDLHLPFSLLSQGDALSQAEKKAHLFDLLRRDAAIFLERHGSKLNITELHKFDVLNQDYEVNWHLKKLKSSLSPMSEKDEKAHANLVKNRRLAFMDRLVQDGDFFSENAMRMRAPLLYHEYYGQFQDSSERAFARPGERWSDLLIRQGEEAEYQARLKVEREKAGIQIEKEAPQRDMEEEEEEEDDDDGIETDDEEGCNDTSSELHEAREARDNVEQPGLETIMATGAGSRIWETEGGTLTYEEQQEIKLREFAQYMQDRFLAHDGKPSISNEELQGKMDDFTRVMQEKFLSGEDKEHFDYTSIDQDSALDDYWLEEMSQDAEDKYFEED